MTERQPAALHTVNRLHSLPEDLPEAVFTERLCHDSVRMERIASNGLARRLLV